ncbi:MAG TPA: AIR synthase-related protein [Holophagaceae bacterium]|nr:AIR synthase-related protein [Holophagaceae bacterium]
MPSPARPQPTPAFRDAVRSLLGRDPGPLELEGLAELARAAGDREILEVSTELPPHLGDQGALIGAFGPGPEAAWAQLRARGGSLLALLGGADREEGLETFVLGAGLGGLDIHGEGELPGAFAAGCRPPSLEPPAPGAVLLRLEGWAPEALGRGAQARALAEAALLPADPVALMAWALGGRTALEVELGVGEGTWGLVAATPDQVEELSSRLGAWGLRAVPAGRLTEGTRVVVHAGPAGEVDLPLDLDPAALPPPFPEGSTPSAPATALPADLGEMDVERTFHALRGMAAARPEAVGKPRDDRESLALHLGVAPHLVRLDPYWGAVAAVEAAALGLACAGAEPLGIALALPREADAGLLMGLRQACVSLELPVLELQRLDGFAAPVAVALGEFAAGAGPVDVEAPEARGLSGGAPRTCGAAFRRAFDGLFLLGERRGELGGSRVLELRGGTDRCPEPWLDEAFRLQACVREGVRLGLLRSARGIGRGGLLQAALEGARVSGLGCQLLVAREGLRLDALCFGEAPGRVLVTTSAEGEGALRTLARTHRVPFAKVGVVGGAHFTVAVDGVPLLDAALADLGVSRDADPTRTGS